MYDFRALKLSKTNCKIYEYYKLNLKIPVDRRYSYTPSIKKMAKAVKKTFV